MPQSELNRLLVLPAIVLAAALSLSGCAALPFFGSDSGSSNNSSSRDDDDDEDDEDDEDDADDDESDDSGSGGCPREFLQSTKETAGTSDFENLTVREIPARDFEPASISDYLDGGCILVLEYSQDGQDGIIYEAFVPGSPTLVDDLDAALVDDGFDNSSESFYVGDDNDFVLVYPADQSTLTIDDLDEQGLGFLGDDFLVITAYKGSV